MAQATLDRLFALTGLSQRLSARISLPTQALLCLAAAAVLFTRDVGWVMRPSLLRPSRLIAWCSLGLAWAVALTPLAAPAFVGYLVLWKFVPPVASIVDAQGAVLPFTWRLVIVAAKLLGRFFWSVVLVPAMFLALVSPARLLWLLGFRPRDQLVDFQTSSRIGQPGDSRVPFRACSQGAGSDDSHDRAPDGGGTPPPR